MQFGTYPVLILAGSRREADVVAAYRGVTFKAIAPVAGKPMISRVLAALRASPWTGKIYISAHDPAQLRKKLKDNELPASTHIESAAATIYLSIRNMMAATGLKPPFLVITADHAMLTSQMLDHLWRTLHQEPRTPKMDFGLAFVSKSTMHAAYPQSRRTYIKFKDGGYSGCNMFAFLTPQALKVLDILQAVEEKRKTPLDLIRMFGILNTLRYLIRPPDLHDAIRRAGDTIGITAMAVNMPWPEAAMDVDTLRDLEIAEAILAKREASMEVA